MDSRLIANAARFYNVNPDDLTVPLLAAYVKATDSRTFWRRAMSWLRWNWKYRRAQVYRRFFGPRPITCQCVNCKRAIPEWWGGYENLHLGPCCDTCFEVLHG